MHDKEDAAHERLNMSGIRGALAWIASGQLAYGAFQFLTSVVMARLLTPHDVGIYALGASIVGFVNVLQTVGLNNYLIRAKEITPQIATTVFSVNLVLSGGLSLVVLVMAVASNFLFNDGGVQKVLACLALIPLIGAFSFIPQSLLEREGHFRQLTLVRTGGVIIGTSVTLVCALNGFSYMSLAYGQIVTACATTIMATAFGRKRFKAGISFKEWRDVAAFAGHSLLTGGTSKLCLRFQELALGKVIGLTSLGLYSRAGNVFSMLWDNVFIIINRVLFVDFSRHSRTDQSLSARYHQALSMITATMWPAFAGLGILSTPFITLVFGARWQGAAAPLALLCVTGIIYTSVSLIWDLFVLAHETARQAKIESIKTLLGTCLFIGGCFISLEAAVLARVLEAVVGFVIYFPHLVRFTQSTKRDLLKIYAISATLTIAAVLPITCVLLVDQRGLPPSLGEMAIAVGFGGVLWATLLGIYGHPLYREAVTLVRRPRNN